MLEHLLPSALQVHLASHQEMEGDGTGAQAASGSLPDRQPPSDSFSQGVLTAQRNKTTFINLAAAAMGEFIRMAGHSETLWLSSSDGSSEKLNITEYMQTFPRQLQEQQNGWKREASRETSLLLMNPIKLVEIFMNEDQWSKMFSSIVLRAKTLEVIYPPIAGNYDKTLQVMTANFHILSPFAQTREFHFLRFCHQLILGTWAVVDVSLDYLVNPIPVATIRRMPSGCLIQAMQNGYSKVTWVEHLEIEGKFVNDIYETLVDSGFAFGAKRWLSTLERQCQRLSSFLPSEKACGDEVLSKGRRSLLKLAEKMVSGFCSFLGASAPNAWTIPPEPRNNYERKIVAKISNGDSGIPTGLVLTAAASFELQVEPKGLFELLRDETTQNKCDIFSINSVIKEMLTISTGNDNGNRVSLSSVHVENTNQNMWILQESYIGAIDSLIVYAPIASFAKDMILNGEDTDFLDLLPSGFAIFPDTKPTAAACDDGVYGALLTIGMQTMIDLNPKAEVRIEHLEILNNMLTGTIARIKNELTSNEGAQSLSPKSL